MNIAASGMQAASLQLAAAASNIVNLNSSGPVPGSPADPAGISGAVYQPLTVSQNTAPDGGVSAVVRASVPAFYLAYDPNAPFANLQGMVAMPNINIHEEMADLISASRTYEANLAVVKNAKSLAMETLSIGKQ